MSNHGITVLVGIMALAMFLLQSILIVPVNRVLLVERLGKYHRTLPPGLHHRAPIFERKKALVDVSQRAIELDQPVIFVDHLLVQVRARVTIQTVDPVAAAYSTVNQTETITQAAITLLRAVLGTITVDDAEREKARVQHQLRDHLDEIARQFGARVLTVEIGELIRPHLATAQQRSAPADFPRDHPEPAGQPAGPSAATRPPQRDVWDPPDALSM